VEKLIALLKKAGIAETDIAAAQEEIEADIEAATAKLKIKNGELIAEKRKLQGSTNEDAIRLGDELEVLKEKYAKLEKDFGKVSKERDTVKSDLEGRLGQSEGAIHKLLIEDGLTKELAALGITDPVYQQAAKALLKEKGILSIKSEGDARRAVAVLKKDGKDTEFSLSDFLTKEWAASDEGKKFIPAAGNHGSGAQRQTGSGSNSGAGKTLTRAQFNALPPAQRMAHATTGGIVTD